jgi:hypothetical protein
VADKYRRTVIRDAREAALSDGMMALSLDPRADPLLQQWPREIPELLHHANAIHRVTAVCKPDSQSSERLSQLGHRDRRDDLFLSSN